MCYVGWKTELVWYVAKLSKQHVEGVIWFLLVAYGKMRERDNLKKELLSKRKLALDDLEKS